MYMYNILTASRYDDPYLTRFIVPTSRILLFSNLSLSIMHNPLSNLNCTRYRSLLFFSPVL